MTTEFAVLMNNVGDDDDDEEGGGDELVSEFVHLVSTRLNALKAELNERDRAIDDYSKRVLLM
jgi:hypothetical protein